MRGHEVVLDAIHFKKSLRVYSSIEVQVLRRLGTIHVIPMSIFTL
jgi:hypothetical protein